MLAKMNLVRRMVVSFSYDHYYICYNRIKLNSRNSPASPLYIEGLCIQYPRYAEEDAYWKSARAFAVLATVVGGLAMISLWLAVSCFHVKNKHFFSNIVPLLTLLCTINSLAFLLIQPFFMLWESYCCVVRYSKVFLSF